MLIFSSMFISSAISSGILKYKEETDVDFQDPNYNFSLRFNYILQLTIIFLLFTVIFLVVFIFAFFIGIYVYFNLVSDEDDVVLKNTIATFKNLFMSGEFFKKDVGDSLSFYFAIMVILVLGVVFFAVYFTIKKSFIDNIQYDNYAKEDKPESSQSRKFLIFLTLILNTLIILAMLLINYTDNFDIKTNWAIVFGIIIFLLIISNYILYYYIKQDLLRTMLVYWLGFVLSIVIYIVMPASIYTLNKNT